MRNILTLSAIVLGTSPFVSGHALGRDVLLNGQDISSARSQELKGVNIRIDDKGNIFIDAPQYRVHEEDSYTPLSRFGRDSAKDNKGAAITPPHQPPRPMVNAPQTGDRDMVPASPEVPLIQNDADASTASAPSGLAAPAVPAEKPGAKSPVTGKRTAARAIPAASGDDTSPSSAATAGPADDNASNPALIKAGQKIGPKPSQRPIDPSGALEPDSAGQGQDNPPNSGE